jgi:apolipoprotein N-acyltransferase
MLFAPLHRVLAGRYRATLPWLSAAAWVGAELARGRFWNELGAFVANPWALLGYALPADGAVAQVASLGGVYAISFVIVSANAGIAAALAPGIAGRRRIAPLVLGALPALGGAAFGTLALSRAPEAQGGTPVALVQADVGVDTSWRRDHYGKNLALYLELTRRAATEARPAVVFWPESSMTFLVEEEEAYRKSIAGVLARGDVQLVAGGPGLGGPSAEPYNSVFVIAPDGSLRARYDKRYLVPFSEYFPLQVFDFVRRRFDRARVYRRGRSDAPLETRAGPAGLLVCNEALFPEVAGRRVRAGASYLLSPSNDGWIPSAAWADRMFAFSALRAVEQRRPVVRVSTSGPSGVVDAYGRTLVRSEPFSQRVVLARVPPPGPESLYARVGDAFAIACAAVALAAGVAALRGGRRRSRTQPSLSSSRSTA